MPQLRKTRWWLKREATGLPLKTGGGGQPWTEKQAAHWKMWLFSPLALPREWGLGSTVTQRNLLYISVPWNSEVINVCFQNTHMFVCMHICIYISYLLLCVCVVVCLCFLFMCALICRGQRSTSGAALQVLATLISETESFIWPDSRLS